MHFLVTYDICNSKRLTKVHNALLAYGIPLQCSIFYLEISLTQMHDIEIELLALIALKEDDLRVYPLAIIDLNNWHRTGIYTTNNAGAIVF
jgi:CRISPR-associated protein Cas2